MAGTAGHGVRCPVRVRADACPTISKRSTARLSCSGPTGPASWNRAASCSRGCRVLNCTRRSSKVPGPTHRWRSVSARVSEEATLTGTLVIDDGGPPLYFRSAAATDVGRVRTNNEDGFVERPESGVWAVADGMGGHSHGEVASRMVCDALAEFPLDGTFEEAIDATRRRVLEVNDHLARAGTGVDPAERSGSTVVVLLLRGPRSAVLWAGDSRAYRWRAGTLEQLTTGPQPGPVEGLRPPPSPA